MTFDTAGMISRVDTILAAVTGTQDSQIGVPSVFTARVSAYVCASGQDFPAQEQTMGGVAYGHLTRNARLVIGFGYATGATAADPTDREVIETAELTLAAWIDSLIRLVLTDVPLRALCEDLSLDMSMNDAPEYRLWGGREIRHWFCVLNFQQSEDI